MAQNVEAEPSAMRGSPRSDAGVTHQIAAAWRRGMMHAIERLDQIIGPSKPLNRRNGRALVEECRRALDELTELQRHNTPATYEEAFDICSADLKAAIAKATGEA